MVLQRLDEGHGPGPVRVFKTLKIPHQVGPTSVAITARVPLAHQLPAGTDTLKENDRTIFRREGLTPQQIAYVESKLRERKLKSDAHQQAFDADKSRRLAAAGKSRLLAQLNANQELAREVIAEWGMERASSNEAGDRAGNSAERSSSLSDKLSMLLRLLEEVGRDIDAWKRSAKVGGSYDHEKLSAMLTAEGVRDWNLFGFAASQMLDCARGTPYARKRGWAKDPDSLRLALEHGFKTVNAES